MADKLVFDIETKNSFADVGGQQNLRDLEVSVVGVYSYNEDTYYCFDEHEMDKLGAMLQNAYLLIGFYSKKFDIPVLEKYFNFNITKIPHCDILEEIEKVMKKRIGLGLLAEANVGAGKTGHGLESIDLYKQGKIQELKDYCVNDVKITKQIYDIIITKGELWIPQKNTSTMAKITIPYREINAPQAQLI